MRNPLSVLAVTASRAAAELAAELTTEEVLAVQDWIVDAEGEAAQWLEQHHTEVEWVACATPAKRRVRASLRGANRPRLLYWAVVLLTQSARAVARLAQAPLPETASFDRAYLGAALRVLEAAEEMAQLLDQPCWNEYGEYWP